MEKTLTGHGLQGTQASSLSVMQHALGARVTLKCGCVSEFRKYGWHCVQSCDECSDHACRSEARLFAESHQ